MAKMGKRMRFDITRYPTQLLLGSASCRVDDVGAP